MTLVTARQMLGAELLKLRRNRAILGFAFVLSVVVVLFYFGYNAIEHASNPAQYLPAGGMDHFERAVRVLGLYFGGLTAVLIGSEAGTADVSSGVFRDLVATGRSRLSLFFVRAPAAIILTLAFNGLGFLVTIAATFGFAGSLPTPSISLILESAAWIMLCNAMLAAVAVGLGSVTGSRAVTLTAVIGWQAIATQLLLNTSSLGSVRDGLLTPALGQLSPFDLGLGVTMATGVALAVLAGWLIVPAALGAWRTKSQDA
jgi:ABC-type transport system involved in multi-copper enzyme maturation permease subunit